MSLTSSPEPEVLCPAPLSHQSATNNESFHQCEVCYTEFTSSDLLVRHMRSCTGPSTAKRSTTNKSKRKSCQACAKSKTKCDTTIPCSNCASGGKECIFLNASDETRARRKNPSRRWNPSASKQPSSSTSSSTLSLPIPISDSTTQQGSSSTTLSDSYSPAVASSDDVQVISLANDPGLGAEHHAIDGQPDPLFQTNPSALMGNSSFHPSGLQAPIWKNVADQTPSPLPLDIQQFPDPTSNHPLPQSSSVGGLSPPQLFSDEPAEVELNGYLSSFFSAFLKHVPLIHPNVWDLQHQPPAVIDVVCACGALCQQESPKAWSFIDRTLKSTRGILASEFGKKIGTSDEATITSLIFAVLLLQHLGIFSHETVHRESANLYHGMLVMMIRRTGLLSKAASWVPPNLSDPTKLEASWREWVKFEMTRRALFAAFVQDCCQCIYFSLPPTFRFDEFNFALPCDDAIWKAKSAWEWYDLLQQPSIYGTGLKRLSGVNFQAALASITEIQSQPTSLVLNPGAHFIIIHALLRNLYVMSTGSASRVNVTFTTQFALYNWMRRWLDNEECMQLEKDSDDLPLWCDVLPFYWLAQVTLFAMQKGTGITRANFFAEVTGTDKLLEMKNWMDQVRSSLRAGGKIPIDLMEIRSKA